MAAGALTRRRRSVTLDSPRRELRDKLLVFRSPQRRLLLGQHGGEIAGQERGYGQPQAGE